MSKKKYGNVKMLLAMENLSVRQGLQNALLNEGFSRPVEANNLNRMVGALAEAPFDVVLTATELGPDFIPPYMMQMRQGGLVHHPLPIIIQFLTVAEQGYVRKVIDSGPDDILQMPVAPAQLISRLAYFTERRTAFIVTSDYVGPDRRKGERPGSMVVPTLDVPNPLAMSAHHMSEEAQKAEIARAGARLRDMRLARYIFELNWLLRAIRQLFEQGSQDAEKLMSWCERIKILVGGLPRLMPKGLPDRIQPMAERLDTGAGILMRSGVMADPAMVQGFSGLIQTLTTALRGTLPADLAESITPAAARQNQGVSSIASG